MTSGSIRDALLAHRGLSRPALLDGHVVVVGLNPTRRGEAPPADVRKADCQVVVAGAAYLPLLEGLDLLGATVLVEGQVDWSALGLQLEA